MQTTGNTKKEQVRKMFNNISLRYDFLNHFLSLGTDILWRKKLISLLKKKKPQYILDIATGTGDLAIAAAKTKPEKIIGIDIAESMLSLGREKVRKIQLEKLIELQAGDAEHIDFPANSFDATMAAFGVRNFENLDKGLAEIHRVLKPGGSIFVLEFAHPAYFPIKQIYNLYFQFVLPLIGKLISKDKHAYTYLYESVSAFPSGVEFLQCLQKAGFIQTRQKCLSFGIARIYYGIK